jgi:AcrR family transcriptional regulator
MSGIREKQLEKRKQETLSVAMRLLLERGYANLNMDELAQEVGISKPTLYQYFESKEALVAQALERMYAKMQDQLAGQEGRSPLEQIEHFLRVVLKARSEQRDLFGPGDPEMLRSLIRGNPNIRQHLQATRNRLAELVRQGQAQGQIDAALPAWVVVGAVFSLQGIIGHPWQKDEPARSEQELAAAIESILEFFRRGVSVQDKDKKRERDRERQI